MANKELCTIEYKKQDISSDALKKFYQNLDKHNVTVGIHKKEGSEVLNNKGYTMIQNACVQEFGDVRTLKKSVSFKSPFTGKWFHLKKGTVIRIPPRVFVRIFTEKTKQNQLTQEIKNVIQANAYKDAKEVYKEVGEYARLTMKERFFGGKTIKPKNKPMTVEYKGFNDPLFMTGRMMNAIKSEVH